MQTDPTQPSTLFRLTGVLVCTTILLGILILGKSFLIPLAWGLVIALASYRMLDRLERKFRIKRLLSSLLYVVLLYLVLIILFYFFYREIVSILNEFPSFSADLQRSIDQGVGTLESYGIQISAIDLAQIHAWITENSYGVLTSIGKTLGHVVLSGVYLFFILLYRDNYNYYLKLRYTDPSAFLQVRDKVKKVVSVIHSFLTGLFKTTLLFSIILYVVFLLIGLKFALFFALLVGLLTLIPYIGFPAGVIIVVVYALVSGDGLALPAMAAAGMVLANSLKSYVLDPIIVGNKIDLNAFVMFLATIVGGLIWGISGILLFIPFTGIARALLEYNEKTRPLAALLATLPKNALTTADRTQTDKDTEE